jgi:5-oxoprolinase (ATP-hydrolysing)
LAITDANLALGRLLPQYFPHIFGATEDLPLDTEASAILFAKLAAEIGDKLSADEVAYGFIKVANESMCRPIRALTLSKGFDTRNHVLASFGGAGGQHACAIARSLGIRKVFVHKYSSVLSAYGLALANVVHEIQEPCARTYSSSNDAFVRQRIQHLQSQCLDEMKCRGFTKDRIEFEVYLNLRYEGTDCAVMTLKPLGQDNWNFSKVFAENYMREFGFTLMRELIIDDIRVRGIGQSEISAAFLENNFITESEQIATTPEQSCLTTSTFFEGGRVDTPVFKLYDLVAQNYLPGPAIVLDDTSTIIGLIRRCLSMERSSLPLTDCFL